MNYSNMYCAAALLLTAFALSPGLPVRADEPGASTLRRVPPPPVKILPMSVIEPPRNVLAAQWKSPYCTQWADGETMCERRNAHSRITCKPIAPSQNYPKPERHPVACFKYELVALVTTCENFGLYSIHATRFFPYLPGYSPLERSEKLDYCDGYAGWQHLSGNKFRPNFFCEIATPSVGPDEMILAERLLKNPGTGNIKCYAPHSRVSR